MKEIEILENKEKKNKEEIEVLKNEIENHFKSVKKYKEVKIGDVLTLEYGSALIEKDRIKGEYLVMGSNGIVGSHNNFTVKGPTIIVGRKGSAGKVTWIDANNYPIDTTFYVKKISEEVDYRFLYYVLSDINLGKLVLGSGVPGLNRNDVYNQTCKLPSLSEQQKIVSEILKTEDQISQIGKELLKITNQKSKVLAKYL